MSASDLVSALNFLIKLGYEIQTRLGSLNQAAEDLRLLNTSLTLLLKVFENPVNEDIIKTQVSDFIHILDILQSIAVSCAKCAKALDIDLAGAAATKRAETHARRFIKRIWALNRIPDILVEIQRKAAQLQQVCNAVSTVIVSDIRTQQGRTSGKETVESTSVVKNPPLHENMNISVDFASIDQMVGNLMKECRHLRQRLQEATLFPDTSAIQYYQSQNPEAASFWKDRFQNEALNASALRYEMLYVSWARFVHEVETSFVLKRIPTGNFYPGDVDIARQRGSRYLIDQSGTRRLSIIRPLWLPSLRSALDPLHKGYVKPRDYFTLLRDSSLSDTLRRLALETTGYGTLVECERASGDLALPATIESPSDHVGWISAQIVAVPTHDELGIVTEREVMKSSGDDLCAQLNDTTPDVHIYVRYLQTGQIERKSLSKQVRPIGGISIGAPLSIRYPLESGGHAWSGDLHITEFKACYGGQYIITVGVGPTAIVFSTRPLKNSFDNMLGGDDSFSNSIMPEFDCTLLGPSKVFADPPKVGEKVQIEYDGLWYDSRVTVVDGDEIEYIDWDPVPTDTTEARDDSTEDESDSGSFFFPEEQLTQLGKGRRRLWRPWRRNIMKYNVRPYRCFHIGDSVEAPVMYPDFRFHYHVTDHSQLYLPARIVGVQGDQYVIEFSPLLTVHGWWPGRMPQGKQVDIVPGSGVKVENPFDFNRVTLGMDLVRPFSMGPRPALGIQSARPSGWSSFQGVHLSGLEDLLERSLWHNDRDSQRTGGQKDGNPFE
ncbi:hypothetical protein F5B22DRAFT_632675 [Xylaria bambusicola]|uniref:uncharacterized protein n=1 Tax=Xylaria bambusicola TaxID=326684 RepID=UPI002007BA32|nr:uncharacterized protein F5B22DRAFT_632675 [Xylaria bambusicola]KAI0528263.1 hypothetical protein F5B22DRAFT_632675 [Xylaria bambusicola]